MRMTPGLHGSYFRTGGAKIKNPCETPTPGEAVAGGDEHGSDPINECLWSMLSQLVVIQIPLPPCKRTPAVLERAMRRPPGLCGSHPRTRRVKIVDFPDWEPQLLVL